jgi:uncharacterized membrane protein YeaQ/YmgE (transglycosylase-associated protein family)
MWIGYSLVVGLIARAIVPLRQPLGTFATLLVGMVGATLGPLVLQWLLQSPEVSPLRPEAFLAAVVLASLILFGYHLIGHFKKQPGMSDSAKAPPIS